MTRQQLAINLSGSWKIHTPQLLREIIGCNRTAWALATPIQIFADKLGAVAKRAIEIGDPESLKLCTDLTLFEESDPYSKEYNPEKLAQIMKGDRS